MPEVFFLFCSNPSVSSFFFNQSNFRANAIRAKRFSICGNYSKSSYVLGVRKKSYKKELKSKRLEKSFRIVHPHLRHQYHLVDRCSLQTIQCSEFPFVPCAFSWLLEHQRLSRSMRQLRQCVVRCCCTRLRN